jgi:hypothetical protein
MIAAITMPLHGSSFYVNATQGIEWYLLLGNVSKHSKSGKVRLLIWTDHTRLYIWISLRCRDHGHVVVSEAGRERILPWYGSVAYRLIVSADKSRYMVCYAKLRQLGRWRSQFLNKLRQSFRWRHRAFDVPDLRRIR